MWWRVGAALSALAIALLTPAGPAWAAAGPAWPGLAWTAPARTGPAVAGSARCGPVVAEPLAEAPWALTRLRPDLAWPLTRGAGVTVAVIDSGVSADHPSLAGKVLPGLDLVAGGSGQCDEHGHGTLVAGIIAARESLSGGYRFHGVAPEATILPIRVLRDQQRTYDTDLSDRVVAALTWAVDVGEADVINLSLTTIPTPELKAAIEHAIGAGAVVVAAAGNEGASGRNGQAAYPAAYDGVIAVAGVDTQDAHVSSSSAGAYVDVAAPGVRIAGPSPAGGGFLFSEDGGTSYATAYVAGVAALVRAYDPTLTPGQVADRITRTAQHPPGQWNPQVGHGIVDPVRAVGALSLAAPEQGLAGRIEPPILPAPERDGTAVAATWFAVAGALVTLAVLVAVPVSRRGRQNGRRHPRHSNRRPG